MAQIKATDLVLGYDGEIIVNGLNFEVNKGNYLCIVGENGSGKSTLMKALTGLRVPMGGQIVFDEGVTKDTIGYLPQQTPVQRDFPASVEEIVISGCQGRLKKRPFYSKADKKLAAENMEKMGIADLSKKCYRELSGGQQQRVLLARALCATEKLLILDEPVAGLDPKVTVEIYELIRKLNKEGITIIMVSHDISGVMSTASHVLHIGKKIFFGTNEEYQKSSIGKYYLELEEDEDE